MAGYLLRRLAASAVMLLGVSVLIFVVLRLLPGDPTVARVGAAQNIDPAALAALREELGLNDPIPVQYWAWITAIFGGELGRSYFSQFDVTVLIGQRLGPTLELSAAGLVLAVLLAVVLAVLPTVVRSRWPGRLVGAYTVAGMAAPPFVFGIVLLAIFSVKLGVLPQQGYVPLAEDPVGNLRTLVLPALTLGICLSAPLIRHLRSALSEVESTAHVRTATGKGIGRRAVVLRHVLPNAMLPALTSLGVTAGGVLSGAVVVEYVFNWPGLGSLIVDSVFKRDYAVIQGTVLLLAAAFVVVNLAVDLLYGVLDPRLRVGRVRR
ncbi:ABC transporter permease [Amycolatopsis albispora]|uniref:ABC transporter permease n=1 Tax=Amycolatopsis albispora TaxID=1804986 RepID=A0A344L1D7_9PSEU|nr:ABC transporter permease [Amycolatopsis albispora]AXB41861.1 ABC transporter permease [Amycolatopsis albispora]